MAFIKSLPKDKKLNEIHDWWNYGINPVTGWPGSQTVPVSKKKYYRTPISTHK